MTVPAAVTGLVVTNGDNQASIAFIPVTATPAVSKYQYQVGSGAWKDGGTGSPMLITGLTNDKTVQIKLRAVNADGNGAASAAVPATPTDTVKANNDGWRDANSFANPGEPVPHKDYADPDD